MRRAKELFGKRNGFQPDNFNSRFPNIPEWTPVKIPDNVEIVNRPPFNEAENEKLATLLNALMQRRDRRARSNELLG